MDIWLTKVSAIGTGLSTLWAFYLGFTRLDWWVAVTLFFLPGIPMGIWRQLVPFPLAMGLGWVVGLGILMFAPLSR